MNSPAEQIIDLYERQAAAFDAERGRSLFEKAWLERFTALCRRAALSSISAAGPASRSRAI